MTAEQPKRKGAKKQREEKEDKSASEEFYRRDEVCVCVCLSAVDSRP